MFFQSFYIFWYVFISTFYFCITFTETLFFRHYIKRHLLTLLTLNVAVHSSGSITLASLRYTRSELLSLISHRLKNRDVISAIKVLASAHTVPVDEHREEVEENNMRSKSSIPVFVLPPARIPEWIGAI